MSKLAGFLGARPSQLTLDGGGLCAPIRTSAGRAHRHRPPEGSWLGHVTSRPPPGQDLLLETKQALRAC